MGVELVFVVVDAAPFHKQRLVVEEILKKTIEVTSSSLLRIIITLASRANTQLDE